MPVFLIIFLGMAVGLFSGLIGLGGGALVVPALIYFMGFSQHMAQGTSLAMMIPPIGALAVWTYYKSGFVDVRVAIFLIIGFFLGSIFGAKLAILIPTPIMKKIFASALIMLGVKMFF